MPISVFDSWIEYHRSVLTGMMEVEMAIPKEMIDITPSRGKAKNGRRTPRRAVRRPSWPVESPIECPDCGGQAIERITPYSRAYGCMAQADHFEMTFFGSAKTYFEQRDPKGGPSARTAMDHRRNQVMASGKGSPN